MYRPVLILMSLFLAGCAGQGLDPEKKQDKASEAEAEAAKATAAIDDAKCQSFGFQPGSPGYAQCRKDFDNGHKLVGGHE